MQRLLHLPYAQIGATELLVDILRPRSNRPVAPAVLYVHGGGWSAGHRSDTPNTLLADQGFATFSISYRFSQHALFPAALHDVKAAIRWIRANAGDLRIDPERIGIWGHSAGGHLAALAALTADLPQLEGDIGIRGPSSRVQAAIPLAGPSWFPADEMHTDAAVARLLGVHQTVDPDLAIRASPAAYAHNAAPPFLIIHGGDDTVVPISQSEYLNDRLLECGRDSELVRVDGAGHNYQDLLKADVMDRVAQFFDRHLGN